MAKYYDIDTSVRINGGLTVNGDTTIPSSFNLYIGGGNLTVTGNITSTANISGNITGTGSSLIVNGTTVNGGQNPISNGWAYTHENKTGSLGHIPTGGSATTFLRGDNTWVTPTDTNNYVSGVSSTSGGNGTLTITRNGLSNLTLDLMHNHDSSYYTQTQINTQMSNKDYYGKWNLLAGATTTGITASANVTVTGSGATTVSLVGNTLTISSTDNNTWRGIDTTPVSGDTSNSIASSWAYTHSNTYGLGAHVPTGGTATTFLRGDNTWVTPTNNYISGISSTSGGNGTLTVTRNGLSNLTLDLSHNHDSSYYTKSQIDTQMGGKDYFGKWTLNANGTSYDVNSSGNITITGNGATTVSMVGGVVTVSSTDNNTWRPIDTTPTSGDTANSIASSWAYTHSNTYGLGSHVPTGGSATTFLRGDGTWVTPIDTNTWRPVDTSPVSGDTSNSIASSWAYTHVNTYGLGSHVPTGGSATTFLRGDGTWVTPTDTNTYVTGLSSTAGGNGTLTVTRNTGGNLTINLAHNHDTNYLGISGTAVNANLLDNIDSSQFVRSDQNDTMTGILTLSGSSATPLVLRRIGTPNINMQFIHDSGNAYLGINGTGQLVFGNNQDLNQYGYGVWHSNNFDPTSKTDNTTFATHTGNTGVGAHIPLGGTTSQFLRGDGTWQTVSTIDTYVTGLSASSGGNGTLTVSRNQGQANLTVDLTHNHDSSYLGINSTAVDSTKFNNLSSSQFVRSDTQTNISANIYFTSGNGVTFQTDSSDSAKIYTEYDGTVGSGSSRTNLVLYVSDDSDDAIVHRVKYYGSGNATDVLTLNYNKATFDAGVGVYVGANKVWHAGNDGAGSTLDADTIDGIESAKFVRNDLSSQSVNTGFTMSANAYVGMSNSSGALYVRTGSGSLGIQLAGDNLAQQSGVKSYINANGNANFGGTVSANALVISSTSLVNNLNAQMVNGVKEPQLAKNISISELCGKGVYIGTQVQAQSVPNMTVKLTSGTVYTDTGMRVTFSAGGNYAFASPSATYNRIDSVYVQGSSAGANEGNITVAQGTASASPVAPSIPSDGILLANVTIRQNAGSILATDITDMRVWIPLSVSSQNIYMGNTVYLSGAIDSSTNSYIQINKPFKSPSNKSVTISSGSTSYTWTHNLNLTNYVVRLSCNSPEPHIYWSNKTSNAITVNLDDTYDSDIIIDISLEAF